MEIRDHSVYNLEAGATRGSAMGASFPRKLIIEDADRVSLEPPSRAGRKTLSEEKLRELNESAEPVGESSQPAGTGKLWKAVASAAMLFSALVAAATPSPAEAALLNNEISRAMEEQAKTAETAGMKCAEVFNGAYVASTGDWHYKSDEAYRDFEPVHVTVVKRILQKGRAGKKAVSRTVRTVVDIAPSILSAAKRHDVSPYLIKAIIAKESSFNPSARSNKGAAGLMQVLPGTARMMGVRDYWSHEGNIEAGTKYISGLLEEFGGIEKALSAYNTGPNNVHKSKHGIPSYTRGYIRKTLEFLRENTGPGW
ncbi:MAG: transglycosylase SLT domain-containing protein [Candidatus Eremiobacteraeota bacterium]|nr:transglycosylase SLT domain-containing protein [Candidatus Eremiobacteraeota bacterium]